MTILTRGQIVYYIQDESITIGIYSLQNRKPFYDFRKKILKSNDGEFKNAADLISLGQSYKLKAVASSKPKLEGAI